MHTRPELWQAAICARTHLTTMQTAPQFCKTRLPVHSARLISEVSAKVLFGLPSVSL